MLQEAVYVLMHEHGGGDGGAWLCTGALISKNVVVTAAHCLNEAQFESWEIVAPLAKDKPRVWASAPRVMDGDWDTIENPDIGFLTLDEPINLAAYATLTDVTARVEKGDKLTAVAVVRTKEEPEAPFQAVKNLAVRSTTDMGYAHGLATQFFSHGGDSGAGLFLFENGAPTHKLIGIARQPDPDVDLDHFTRVDADFLAWIKGEGGL